MQQPPEPAQRRLVLNPADILAIVLLVALVGTLQYVSGAYRSDFDANDDEPAHVVNSLMIRDYLAHGFPGNPIRFAENYYVHYPKVAIGHWPPLFHAAEAIWMLAIGPTAGAMLSFVAIAGALLAASVYLWVRRDCGALAAFACAAILTTTHFVQAAVDSVSPDILLALLAFWATAAYGEFVENRRRRYVVLYALLTACAIGVHGRGAPLLLLPLVASAIRGRLTFSLWRVLLFATMCVLVAWLVQRAGQSDPISASAMLTHAGQYVWVLCVAMTWPVVAVASAGVVWACRSRQSRAAWSVMLALPASTWMFHSFINVPIADQYLITAAPAVAALFAGGWNFAARSRTIRAGLAVLAGLVIIRNVAPPVHKPDLGLHTIANQIGHTADSGKVTLVAGNAIIEGAFVSAMALHDTTPAHIVLRASKVLAHSTWSGRDYRVFFHDPESVSAYLDDARVDWILLASAIGRPHEAQLAAAIREAGTWEELHVGGVGAGLRTFRRVRPLPPGTPNIRIDMRDKFGRYFELAK